MVYFLLDVLQNFLKPREQHKNTGDFESKWSKMAQDS